MFGSRLAVRLVLLFALVAVLPGALVYAVSVQFLGKSIESWFDVRVDRALEGGLNLGAQLARLSAEGHGEQGDADGADAVGRRRRATCRRGCNRAAEQAGVYEATLFSATGGVLAVAGVGGSTRARRSRRRAQALRRARLQQPYTAIEQTADGGLAACASSSPVNTDDRLEPLEAAAGRSSPCRERSRRMPRRCRPARATIRRFRSRAQALKRLYALTLTLTLLLALTSALGLAVVLSERFAAPLGLLAEGTRAVAQGDFTRRQPVTSRDELGVLTESFNTMTAQLAEAQHKTEESRRATETTRAYLESILGNLSAGVLAFDDQLSAAHRQRERGGDPAAAARASSSACRCADWGTHAAGARAVRRARRARAFAAAATALAEAGGARRSRRSRACC